MRTVSIALDEWFCLMLRSVEVFRIFQKVTSSFVHPTPMGIVFHFRPLIFAPSSPPSFVSPSRQSFHFHERRYYRYSVIIVLIGKEFCSLILRTIWLFRVFYFTQWTNWSTFVVSNSSFPAFGRDDEEGAPQPWRREEMEEMDSINLLYFCPHLIKIFTFMTWDTTCIFVIVLF